MNERILKALMTLFAIIAEVDEDGKAPKVRAVVEAYLLQHLNKELTAQYLQLFDNELERLHKRRQKRGVERAQKQLAVNSVRVLIIAQQLNEELIQKEKIIVILRLFDFFIDEDEINGDSLAFLDTLGEVFNIPVEEYVQVKALCLSNIDEIRDSSDLLTISHFFQPDHRKFIHAHNLDGEIYVLNLQSVNTYIFQYTGTDALYLNGQPINNNHVNLLESGSAIKSSKFSPVYFSDISNKFIAARHKHKVVLRAEEIEFRFKASENGVQRFSFSEESGNMIGIMGGSGVGKSTLLNVLNGNLPMNSGKITINGYDIRKDREKIEGVIGFVPQDDLLIEELTVFENLFFNAKLCFADFTRDELVRLVAKILVDLDLNTIKHLKVGNPLNKFISGGQRKRLNIALELMREPSILIVDEPTSGLSSMDSEIVMSLLKEQAIKGKLVIVNIHQPSSDIFKMFDRLLVMDKGGHPVYYGNPVQAVVYFKKANHIANAEESQCAACGNVNPEQILEIVESKMVNEHGRLTRNRKRSPQDWYYMYRLTARKLPEDEFIGELPENNFKRPSLLKQFIVFLSRNVLAKLTNRQYLLINFFEAPLLAIILGYFTKYIAGTDLDPSLYVFSKNENLPAYLFMSVIVALFLGMTVSAEEIIRDRRILKRESFLNLSKFAYLNSKVVIMFLISAVQMFTFVLIGNFILGIDGLMFEYWFLLFSTAAFANLVGLNISSSLNSVVNIYILIPFILVPQLLLSGVIVSFDKLHQSVNSSRYVPVVGDLMVSRWAYEALAVKQFKHNNFEKHFFWTDLYKSSTDFQYIFLIPELEMKLKKSLTAKTDEEKAYQLKVVREELLKFPKKTAGVPLFKGIDMLEIDKVNSKVVASGGEYLEKLKRLYRKISRELDYERDSVLTHLIKKEGSKDGIVQLKTNNFNERLSSTVRNENSIAKIKEEDGRLIQLKDPIFMIPEHNFGRAHFYAPIKKVLGVNIATYWFNSLVIWFSTLILYYMLLTSGFGKLMRYTQKYKFFKSTKNLTK